jgi:GDP-mannose 6-dehydrogenase
MVYAAKTLDIELPLLRGVLESNRAVIQRTLQQIIELGVHRIGLIGLSFKADTDDLRESPFVELAEQLLGKGFDLTIYDPNVSLARLVGANRDYIEKTIPHLSTLLVPSLQEVAAKRELIVIGHHFPGVDRLIEKQPESAILDLTKSPTGQLALGQTAAEIA